jgi:hypothetical protein
MSEFKWDGEDSDAVILTWQPRTAAYRNGQGGLTIRQEADAYSEDRGDDQIFLTPMGALSLAWRLIELAHEAGIPKPDRLLMSKPLDLGPTEPTVLLAPTIAQPDLVDAMREAAE